MYTLNDRLQSKSGCCCSFSSDRLKSMTIGHSELCASIVEHREHGNRILHEFLLGQENIRRSAWQPKSNEYEHELFLSRCTMMINRVMFCLFFVFK
jgi:hypothetical protein